MNEHREFYELIEARMAFAHRRRELIENWVASHAAGFAYHMTQWAKSIELCNDSEYRYLGGEK